MITLELYGNNILFKITLNKHFRSKIEYNDSVVISVGEWAYENSECIDHVIRGCYNNGTCVGLNTCVCTNGWSQSNNGGECVVPDTCKCKQWKNSWRDGRSGGGVPLYQDPDGNPQMTGWA